MRFVCENCQTRYSIPDDKARGRALKVRCKKCNNVIIIKPGGGIPEVSVEAQVTDSSAQDATLIAGPEEVRKIREALRDRLAEAPTTNGTLPVPAEAPAAQDVEWFVIVSGKQKGPMTKQALVDQITARTLSGRNYVWSDELPDWKRLQDVPALALWITEPTDRAVPAARHSRQEKAPKPAEPSPAKVEPAASPSSLDSMFDDPSTTARAPEAPQAPVAAESPASTPAAAEADPFQSVPDSPDMVRPAMGEQTRFVISQSGIEKQKSPWRIAVFIGGGLLIVAGLVFALSQLGVNIPGVISHNADGTKFFSSSKGGGNLKDQLLGIHKGGGAPPAPKSWGPAPAAPKVAPKDLGPLAHKDAQKVEQIGKSDLAQLQKLYGKSSAGYSNIALSKGGQTAAVDRPDAPLSPKQVASTVAHFQSGYGRCMDVELKRNPGFRGGKVRIVTTIMSSGLVRQAEVQSDDAGLVRRVNDSSLGKCLVDTTRRMVFPNFAGDPFDAEIPLVLGSSM